MGGVATAKANRGARGDLRCPHCGAAGHRRTSTEITEIYRKIDYFCTNAECGHTWVASLAYEYGLSPSANPNPAVTLPLRPVVRAASGMPDNAAPGPPERRQPRLFD